MLRDALGEEMMKRVTDSYSAIFEDVSTYAIQPRSLRGIKGSKCLEDIRFRNNKIVHEYVRSRESRQRGKVNEVDVKTEWKYSLKWLALSLLDETKMEFRNIVEGREYCFERDFRYL